MNKLITIMPCLFLSFVITAQTKPAATQLPTLSKAREIGRSKSNLLNTKNLKNSSSQLAPKANLSDFNKVISPLFKNKCLACHGPKKVKGKFRIDKLDPNLLKGADINKWLEVYEVLSNSEMPPDDEPDYHLADADRSKIVDWLGAEVRKASQVRRNEKGHSSFRRMARYEYNNALQDLLGLPYDFVERLVTETISEDGFKNSSEHLNMTAMQFQIYREIGLQALKKSTVSGEQPQPVTYSISMQEEMEKGIKKLLKKRAKDQRKAAQKKGKQKKAGKKKGKTKIYIYNKKDENYKNILRKLRLVNRQSGDVILSTLTYFAEPNSASAAVNNPPPSPVTLVLNQNKEIVLNLGNHLPDEGTMRISIRVSRTTMKENDYASLRLLFGAHTSNNANFMEIVSKADMPVTATPDKPQIIHFDIPLSEIRRNPFRKNKTVFPRRDELLTIKNISNVGKARKGQESLEVLIHHIEISGPYYEQWPPKTHSDIFIKSQNKSDENKYCRQILKRFMQRSWRRPVTSAEVERYAALFSKFRPQLANFEDTMLEVLAAVLASPEFLYLTQTKQAKVSKSGGNISDFELANRLSFFLWSSLPDLTLLKLAHQQKLNDPKVLLAQVKRLLADKRGQRFSQSFVPQWLGLDGIHSVSIDKKLHTSFNPDLQESMLKEPLAFFSEVLKNNSSIMDFIHSDYAVINQSLARHYKVPNIYGPHFRKVAIKPANNRGGILTSAIVSTMNSNGKESNPLKRGVWLLEHFLNDPPPPPPANVPEVDLTDPEILKMTLKEQIENHRDNAACRSCHAKIDPWGIAFENYDAIGSFRTQIKQKPVDATSTLFNKQELAGMHGLKHYLLSDRQDQFATAFVHKMLTYALGRPLTFSDRTEVNNLSVKLRKNGDRLGTLVNIIVTSKIFQSK